MNAPGKTPQQRIEDCQKLARSLAGRIHRTLPPYLDLDDLIGYAQVGLAEAARDFDPGRGGKFSTFAYYRIRGAIYDGLSKLTWFSRAHYRRIRHDQLTNDLLRLDGETEQTGGTDPDVKSEALWLRNMSRALAVVYIATHADSEDDSQELPLSDTAGGPPAMVMQRETVEKLHALVDALPADAARLIRATYFEGLSLQDAGKRLGVSKSWASRLHAKTLQRLGRALRLLGAGE